MKDTVYTKSPLDMALELADTYGFHVFPVIVKPKPNGKSEKIALINWGSEASNDPDAIEAMVTSKTRKLAWQYATHVGVSCEPSRVWVVDEDVQGAADKLNLPETLIMATRRGRHYVYRAADFDQRNTESFPEKHVDIRANGGMFVVYGQVIHDADIAPWPFKQILVESEKPKPEATSDFFDLNNAAYKTIEEYNRLWGSAAIDGEKHKATIRLAASLAAQGVSQICATGLIMSKCPVWDDNLKNSIISGYRKFAGNSFRHNGITLVRDDKGFPIWCAANADALIQSHDDWRDVLGYNALTVRPVLHRPIPGHQDGKAYPRDLVDSDYTAALEWFNRNGFPKATKATVVDSIDKACERNTFDPLLQYLDGLKWDGVNRIDGWLQDYCNAMPETAEAIIYTQSVAAKWMISAVARAYKPGCKADHMLVLEGEQGRRKSSVLAALAGPEWFGDSLPPMNTKDASSYLRGKWIVEVAELEAMRREVDAIKAFISRQVEDFRGAYVKLERKEPRRCIFAGTTNKDDWQKDVTGGRRFWPVTVNGIIDVEGVAEDRDQLWAEAVARFKAGEIWWLDGEAEEQAKVEVEARSANDDPWMSEVSDCIAGQSEIAIKQVLMHIGIPPEQRGRKESDRIADILRQMGWTRAGQFSARDLKGAARYVRGVAP